MKEKLKFKIEYFDSETNELITEIKYFEGNYEFPPIYWAEDYAYSKANKGWYSVEEIK